MQRKIAITAIKWNPEYHNAVRKGLIAAKNKYKDGLLVIVGYTIIGVKIASIAAEIGLTVHMYAPDLNIQPRALDIVSGITITSTTKPEYMKYMISNADGVMAFDEGDPVVMAAKREGKAVWFPLNSSR